MQPDGIAVIGMSCCFPDAESPEKFWENLRAGVDSIIDIPPSRLTGHFFDHIRVGKGSFIRDPYLFDNDFFSLGKEEAEILDPQQRLLLELASEAITRAGYSELKNKPVAVFIGATQRPYADMIGSDYYRRMTVRAILDSGIPETLPPEGKKRLQALLDRLAAPLPTHPSMLVGNILNMLASRISHELNLTGPSLAVDTACSSSLVAIHLACRSLIGNECEMALAGGVNLNLTPSIFHYMELAGATSPTGMSRPFSQLADGMVPGEGGGLILLKKYSSAVQDGDPILAVIMGSGINNDGRSLGVMAPNPRGQLALFEKVYRESGYDPRKITFLEAHGTGTRIGDALEMNSIKSFFGPSSAGLSVGSVKSNIGHLLGAAGIAGFIKVVLALKHQEIPPSLHVGETNPKWKLDENNIRVQTGLGKWEAGYPRAAGINSFGFGGTNCHVILEEAPRVDSSTLKNKDVPLPDFHRRRFFYPFFPETGREPQYLYQLVWNKVIAPDAGDHVLFQKPVSGIIVNAGVRKDPEDTGRFFDDQEFRMVHVFQGEEFVRKDETTIRMNLMMTSHFKWLFSLFDPQQFLIQIHAGVAFAPGDTSIPAEAYQRIFSLIAMIRSLIKGLTESGMKSRIVVITQNAFTLPEIDPVSDPGSHAFATAVMGIFEENPALRGGLIDTGSEEITGLTSGKSLLSLISFLLSQGGETPFVFRHGEMYLPELVYLPEEHKITPEKAGSEEGIFLVAGGSSGVGLEITRYLAGKNGTRIYLTGTRTPEDFQKSNELPAQFLSKITFLQSDITDSGQLKAVIDQIYLESGMLTGIFYAPGSMAYGSFSQTDDESTGRVLAPKILGLLNLSAALQDHKPGFVCLMSSISAIAPRFSKGLAVYGAANAFMDAFSMLKKSQGENWISVNWSLWNNTGMGKLANTPGDLPADGIHPLDPGLAIQLLMRILSSNRMPMVVIDPIDRQKFTFRYSGIPKGKPENGGSEAPPAPYHAEKADAVPCPQPDIHPEGSSVTESKSVHSPKTFPGDDVKAYLKEKIMRAGDLKNTAFSGDDSFQMLGIDSLAALDVIAEIQEETGASLHPTLLFEHDTLNKLTRYLEAEISGKESPAQIEASKTGTSVEPCRLLPSQQTFYANHLFHPDQPCTMFVRLDLPIKFDPVKLENCFMGVLTRHEALCVAFKMTDSGPVQQFRKLTGLEVEFHHFTGEHQDSEMLEVENNMVNTIFELDKPPLVKVACCYSGDGNSSLMVSMHHIVADALSLGIVIREFLDDYLGTKRENSPVSQNFFDYVTTLLLEKKRSPDPVPLRFWEKEFEEMPDRMNLPYAITEEASSINSGMESRKMDPFMLENLLHFSRLHHITLFQSLLAGCFLFFRKLCRQDALMIRVAVLSKDRMLPGVESMVGCLADSIPVSFRFDEHEDFPTLLERLKNKILACMQNGAPGSLDLAGMQKVRNAAGPSGVSPVGLSFIDFDALKIDNNVPINSLTLGSAMPFTDLSLIAVKFRGELHLSWIYRKNQIAVPTMNMLADDFLLELKKLPDNEVKGTPGTAVRFPALKMPATTLFPELGLIDRKLLDAMDLFADRVALEENGVATTYTFLKKRISRISNGLRQVIGQENPLIGILAYPGMEAVSGIVGIIASGAAYVPLDPDWPDGRIERIMRHSGMKILLCSGHQAERVKAIGSLPEIIEKILILDPLLNSKYSMPEGVEIIPWQNEPESELLPPQGERSPDHLIHVMYTSGTSGNPKGVMVTHRAVEIFLDWIAGEFRIGEEDRFIMTSSLGFGGSIRQIYSTLLAGATMVPVPRMVIKDPEGLLDFLINQKITILNTVSTLLTRILDVIVRRAQSGRTVRLDHLRLLLIGGEVLPAETVRKWMDLFGLSPRIVNLYGSTETVVNATLYFVNEVPDENVNAIPIGKARDGCRVILLNEKGRYCADGETGEILAGGPGIAKGYLHDPQLTSEKFVFLDEEGGAYYRTGDLAKRDTKGLFWFLGRNDQQIQLYGNRIELSEIENTIHNSGFANSTAVVAVEEEDSVRIIAYVEPSSQLVATGSAPLRDYIAAHLPVYMIPHHIELIDNIPLNQAGKIDKRRLKALAGEKYALLHTENPFSPTENILAETWRQLLKTAINSPDADFFNSGGDSIQMLDMIYRLEKHFPVVPTPPVFYAQRTIRKLAAEIDKLNAGIMVEGVGDKHDKVQVPHSLPPSRSSNESMRPLSPSQKGFLLAQKLNPEISPNWCIILPVKGSINPDLLNRAIDFVVSRHPMLRAVFTQQGFQTFRKQVNPGSFPLEILDYRSEESTSRDRLLSGHFEKMKNRIINFRNWPLFAMELIRLGERESCLAVSIHHAIGDAWSLHIICGELLMAYDALQAEKPLVPEELQSTYDDYVSYCRNIPSGEIALDREFWKNQFIHFQSRPDREADPSAERIGETSIDHAFNVGSSDFDGLCEIARKNNTSPFILFLTLWARVLRSVTANNRFMTGIALSGRDVPVKDIHKLVGCFAKAIPIPLSLEGSSMEEDIRTVGEVFNSCYSHSSLTPGEIFESMHSGIRNPDYAFFPYFLSYMDFRSVNSYESPFLKPDWPQARSYFNTGSVDARLMLGVTVRETVRINLYGTADQTTKSLTIQLLQEEISRFLSWKGAFEEHPVKDNTTHPGKSNLDSALIAYWPSAGTIEEFLKHKLPGGDLIAKKIHALKSASGSSMIEILTSRFGKSAIIMIPVDAQQLQTIPRETLITYLMEAVRIAGDHMVMAVSLAGNLPSRTNYCFDLVKKLRDSPDQRSWPRITSGHATTVVAVVKNIRKVLLDLDIDIRKIRLGVIGFGSIGQASLSLLLETTGIPESLVIADLESQLPLIGRALHGNGQPGCPVKIRPVTNDSYPEELYESHLLIGASTGRIMLDLTRVRPGTILVDDSFPTIIPVQEAISRMNSKKDILFVGGGKIDIGETTAEIQGSGQLAAWVGRMLKNAGFDGIPGCRLESMLLGFDPGLPEIHGLVSREDALIWYHKCEELGLKAVPFHLENFRVEQDVVDHMKREMASLQISNRNE